MTDYNSLYQQSLYLSPEQQSLLLTALSTTPAQNPINHNSASGTHSKTEPSSASSLQSQSKPFDVSPTVFYESPTQDGPDSGHLGFGADESPFLDFDADADFDFQGADQLIGEIPDHPTAADESETGEKRKGIDGQQEDPETGKKRRESEDKEKASKKPGRKPLTSEPTSVRF
jgi:AP-1-like transcription factor